VGLDLAVMLQPHLPTASMTEVCLRKLFKIAQVIQTEKLASRYLIRFAAYSTVRNVHPQFITGFGNDSAKPAKVFISCGILVARHRVIYTR
jgi:hypothetical protein